MTRDDRDRHLLPYWVRFLAITAALLFITGVLVLVVMPDRFVLEAGLRESGVSFPSSQVGFEAPESAPLVQPPPPPPAPVEPAPGPAEVLWAALGPVLEAGRWDVAVTLMDAYLRERPTDYAVRRERARTLARAGRSEQALAAWEELAAETMAVVDRLELARALRDRGDYGRAIVLYEGLVRDRPGEMALQWEYARALLWGERYREAITLLRELLAKNPADDGLRLDLARALYWGGRPAEAAEVLALLPEDSPLGDEARALSSELAAVLAPPPQPEPPELTLAERARVAAAEEDLAGAADCTRRRSPRTREPRPVARVGRLPPVPARGRGGGERRPAPLLRAVRPEPEERYRLAELHAWTGQRAKRRRSSSPCSRRARLRDAWTLLGDLRRWRDDPVGAARVPKRAGWTRERERATDSRAQAPPGGDRGPERGEGHRARDQLFADSDEFLRLDVAGDLDFRWGVDALAIRAGYRRLEGFDPSGLAVDDGGFGQLTYAHWWREASVRTALDLGLEHLQGFGAQVSAAIDVQARNVAGFSLTGRLETAPAYRLANTYESVAEPVRADRLFVSLFRPLGDRWSVSAALDAGLFDGPGDPNPRYAGWVTLSRSLSRVVSAEIGTSLLGFGDASPAPDGRRLYWDPELYWATTAALSASSLPDRGWGWKARLMGGAAWNEERGAVDGAWVPQYGVEGGVVLRGENQDLGLEAFYRRGREQDYASWGVELVMIVRP